MITFTVEGEPQGKGRARSFMRKDKNWKTLGFAAMPKIGHVTPKDTRAYEKLIRDTAWLAMRGHQMFEGAVRLELLAVFSVPKSWSIRKREAALNGEVFHTSRPDADNILKAFKDAMNGVVYRDDSRVVEGMFAKLYGAAPSVSVTVVPL
jgi:Holliday junction resolvase RusA-like endonuclease